MGEWWDMLSNISTHSLLCNWYQVSGNAETPYIDQGVDYQLHPVVPLLDALKTQQLNWLQVLGTAELAQIDQRVRQQLHAIVPLLDALEPQEEPLELIFPGKGPFDTHPQRMDRFIEEAFASALRALTVPGILWDVGDQARIEYALPIVRGIKAAIEVERGASQV